MSWLFSQALVEEYSGVTSSDGELSAPLSGNPTQLAYLPLDRMTAFSRLSRFGMTFKPLTESLGRDVLTSYLEDFPVRTFLPLDGALASKEPDRECGSTWQELLARYDPVTSLWKTPQCSLLGDYTEFSETWPRWGLMQDGVSYQRQTLVRPIKETESGSWPTPRSCSAMAATITPDSAWAENRFPNLETVVGRRLWPTPDASSRGPTKDYNPKSKSQSGRTLQSFVAKFPTPQASDNRDRGNMSNPAIQRRIAMGKQIMLSQSVDQNSGQLNPTWVEWLMGWPLGWTDLKPLAMDKYQQWRQQHGIY
jgi:hypothetical protein